MKKEGCWIFLKRQQILKTLIERHLAYAGSAQAKRILADWNTMRARFVKVFPNEYRRALGELAAASRMRPVDPELV